MFFGSELSIIYSWYVDNRNSHSKGPSELNTRKARDIQHSLHFRLEVRIELHMNSQRKACFFTIW